MYRKDSVYCRFHSLMYVIFDDDFKIGLCGSHRVLIPITYKLFIEFCEFKMDPHDLIFLYVELVSRLKTTDNVCLTL